MQPETKPHDAHSEVITEYDDRYGKDKKIIYESPVTPLGINTQIVPWLRVGVIKTIPD